MIQVNEIVMLLLGCGGLLFIRANRPGLARIPSANILIAGYGVLFAGWTLTVLEGFFWGGALNYLEHICYALSSVLVALWCVQAFDGEEKAR